MLIQLGAARGRGGVEPVITGRATRGRYDVSSQTPSFPIPIQTDSTKLQDAAKPRLEESGAQEFSGRVDPLYLFSLGVLWHQHRNASAGWDLIQFLRSPDREVRAMAATLLAKTEYARILVRDLRRARAHVPKPAAPNVPRPYGQMPSKVAEVNTPYGLEIVDSCLTCKLRKDPWFCCLSTNVLKLVSAASHLSTYPGNAVLFVEGQMPRGAYVLCSGKAKL